jgi:nucleoside-diphosphate-sugar epimerase
MEQNDFIAGPDDLILITGATGFIGPRLVETLLHLGLCNLRCLARHSSPVTRVEALRGLRYRGARVEVVRGNLLSSEDSQTVARDAAVIFHLAAGRGEKSIPEAFRNSVVTTRNLLEASIRQRCLKRFVNVSSFSVYTNRHKPRRRLLDESCPVETHPQLRGDAYTFAKTKQDEIVAEYASRFQVPYVIVRPGYVIGPGNPGMSGRVGTSTFGVFLHLGGSNPMPFTYVDNCADAIALAGLRKGVDGEVFNVVDDDLPSSRRFLRLYKQDVKRLRSIRISHPLSYVMCCLWERYSAWSRGQLPPAFNRRVWHAYWKKTSYSNEKLKTKLGWRPMVGMADALRRHLEACRADAQRA